MTEQLMELADRCEKATGPSVELRDLDRAIKAALLGREYISYEDDLAKSQAATPPRFTASLDAAMQLVPERSWVRMDEWPHDFCHGPVASIQPIREPQVPLHVATGSTLALALCAAALRARAQSNNLGGGDE